MTFPKLYTVVIDWEDTTDTGARYGICFDEMYTHSNARGEYQEPILTSVFEAAEEELKRLEAAGTGKFYRICSVVPV